MGVHIWLDQKVINLVPAMRYRSSPIFMLVRCNDLCLQVQSIGMYVRVQQELGFDHVSALGDKAQPPKQDGS